MATYTVNKGDTLQSIAKKKGYSNWKDLWNSNVSTLKANFAKTGNYLLKGGTINLPSSSSSFNVKASGTTPSKAIAKTLGTDQTRQGFEKRFGMEQQLRPDAAFTQVAEENVNPEQLRLANKTISGYDLGLSTSGAWRTGQGMLDRGNLVNDLERQRKEAVNAFIQPQRELFSNWYNKELEAYGTSKNPNKYTLSKFNVDLPGVPAQVMSPSSTKYQYNTPFNYGNLFKYGGYSAKANPFGTVTAI